LQPFPSAYQWNLESASKFQDALCHPICKNCINDFMNKSLDNNNGSDSLSLEFTNILHKAATKL